MPNSQKLFFTNIENIHETLESAAQTLNIAPEMLDFYVQHFRTHIKAPNAESFDAIDNVSDEIFSDCEVIFRQIYDIVVFKRRFEPKMRLESVNNFERLDIIFFKNFIVPKNIAEFDLLINEISALKVARGIFLRNLDSEKKLIYENLKNLESPLKSEVRFTLTKAPSYEDSRFAKFEFDTEILCSEKFPRFAANRDKIDSDSSDSSHESHESITLSNLDLTQKIIIAIKENTRFATFYDAFEGKVGRNLRGEIITPSEKTSTLPNISEDIKCEENAASRAYFSRKSGFVVIDQNQISLLNEIALQNVEVKDNYCFLGDLDAECKIIVSTASEFEDAVKTGVSLRAKNIEIKGNLASNTQIECRELKISGATHKSSIISAQNAVINAHRGELFCENATINSLESGALECINLSADKANGGEIRASEIKINELYSNSLICFGAKLEVQNLRGGGNKITFTALALKSTRQKITALNETLESKKAEENALQARQNALLYKYKKYHQTALDLKKQIDDCKAKQQQIPEFVVKNYAAFLHIVDSLKKIKLETSALKKAQNAVIKEIRAAQKDIFNAEFICHDGWLKYNDVIFELSSPKICQSKTIIKGVGRYFFDAKEKRLVHKNEFAENDGEIDNFGF